MEKDNNKKLCCYLMACSDLICFVGGSLLLSLAIFGSACTSATCDLSFAAGAADAVEINAEGLKDHPAVII